jgi:hypothetical protein
LLTAVRHALVAALSTAQYRQVKFLTPEETFSFLDGLEAKVELEAATPDPKRTRDRQGSGRVAQDRRQDDLQLCKAGSATPRENSIQ